MAAPTVESASVIVAVPAVAGAWALAGQGVVVGLLTASGTVSGMGSSGSRGWVRWSTPAGRWWGSTRSRCRLGLDGRQDEGGYRRGRDGWGDRVARRRPALVSRATVTSLGAEGLATSAAEGVTSTWCIVRLGFLSRLPGSRPTRPTSYERCLVVSRYAPHPVLVAISPTEVHPIHRRWTSWAYCGPISVFAPYGRPLPPIMVYRWSQRPKVSFLLGSSRALAPGSDRHCW
jgi:hypothetical protein